MKTFFKRLFTCDLESFDVADSADHEGPESALLDPVLVRDQVHQTVLSGLVPGIITKLGKLFKYGIMILLIPIQRILTHCLNIKVRKINKL